MYHYHDTLNKCHYVLGVILLIQLISVTESNYWYFSNVSKDK